MMRAPLYTDIAQAPAGGQAHWRMCSDGVRIRVAHWVAENAKGTVILCPGRTEYIEKYGRAVAEFLASGLSVIVNDWRGQGLADRLVPNRLLGHVKRFSDYQHDVREITQYADDLGLSKPYHLVAHSMGGCITLRSLMTGLAAKTATFSGPMWGIELSRAMRTAAWSATTVLNPLPLRNHLSPGADPRPMMETADFADNLLTEDPEYYEFMVDQTRQVTDLALAGPTIGWLHGALREMRRLSKRPSPKVPCLTFVGTAEDIVDPNRIGQRMAQWGNGQLITV
ncbi:MAG: alpha/beta hydrolase, partial [Pseudomonadota bacterium]